MLYSERIWDAFRRWQVSSLPCKTKEKIVLGSDPELKRNSSDDRLFASAQWSSSGDDSSFKDMIKDLKIYGYGAQVCSCRQICCQVGDDIVFNCTTERVHERTILQWYEDLSPMATKSLRIRFQCQEDSKYVGMVLCGSAKWCLSWSWD